MNKETKAWYKKAQAETEALYYRYESGDISEAVYNKEMAEIAEYYIMACDFDLPAFSCNPFRRFFRGD